MHHSRLSSTSYRQETFPVPTGGPLRQAKRRLTQLFQAQSVFPENASTRLHGQWLVFSDPPKHTRMRAAIQEPFNARVRHIRPKVQALAQELVTAARQAGTVNLQQAVAYPLPIGAIGQLLGMPPDAPEQLKDLPLHMAGLMTRGLPQTPDSLAARLAIIAYFEKLIADKRQHRMDDLISDLVTAQEQGLLNQTELVTTAILLWFAGYDTTHRLILQGTDILLRHPEQFAQLKQNPALVPNAVQELLRLISPTQWVKRLALTDVTIGARSCTRASATF